MDDLRTDEALLAHAPKDPAAFDAFYLRHERLVLAWLRRRTGSADTALDLTAETFVAALASARRYRPGDGPPVAWLLGIARHKLLRSFERGQVEARARRKLAMARVEYDDEDLARVDALGSWPAEKLLALLPPDQAAAVSARVLEEQPYREVAAILQCSELVARKRVSRGLATLRAVLEEEEA
ncbi:RNA polymerase sigma factor [Solirubrobacter phytolaccae]|uniref:RNA polymerase sigma factor n=1 Tax=Solirubrobacter phytolaccae TaxID=1404360 RepID=A0A9X3N8E4_9ACTN|nr:RNA polymerase sigma factor [Solirubrobacter phytolaccae]MDA0181648.1 RNA polymerase sigma factor [Solirubrobacter phytolaccae]